MKKKFLSLSHPSVRPVQPTRSRPNPAGTEGDWGAWLESLESGGLEKPGKKVVFFGSRMRDLGILDSGFWGENMGWSGVGVASGWLKGGGYGGDLSISNHCRPFFLILSFLRGLGSFPELNPLF